MSFSECDSDSMVSDGVCYESPEEGAPGECDEQVKDTADSSRGSTKRRRAGKKPKHRVFVKVIQTLHMDRKGRLDIDRRYLLRCFGGGLHSSVTFRCPDGRSWYMPLTLKTVQISENCSRRRRLLCIRREPWQCFAINYGLKVGFSMEVTHCSNQDFDVKIYDTKSDEISYSSDTDVDSPAPSASTK